MGDAYLAVGNLRTPQQDCHARRMAQFAFSAVRAANSLSVHPERPELGFINIRVGLHCGPVVGRYAVVGLAGYSASLGVLLCAALYIFQQAEHLSAPLQCGGHAEPSVLPVW